MNPIVAARLHRSPGFWMNETTGVLRPVVLAYFAAQTNQGPDLTPQQVATMRAYLRQWIAAPGWLRAEDLRAQVETIRTHADVVAWVNAADDRGMDPF